MESALDTCLLDSQLGGVHSSPSENGSLVPGERDHSIASKEEQREEIYSGAGRQHWVM